MRETPLILVVDDVPTVRVALCAFLEELGYNHESVCSCSEAAERVRAKSFSCVIVDLGLPDGNGLTLLPVIEQFNPWCVPIILTADSRPETIVDTMRAGAFDYLVKPVGIDAFGIALRRALEHHRVIRERDTLLDELRQERELLSSRVKEATAGLQQQAARIELANTRQKVLLQLSRVSDDFYAEESLLRTFSEEIVRHIPLQCLALTTPLPHEYFVAAMPRAGQPAVVVTTEGTTNVPEDLSSKTEQLDSQIRVAVERHTGLDTREWTVCVYPEKSMGRVFCMIAFFLPGGHEVDADCDAFLNTCASIITSRWQDARLFQYAAKQASVGNLALDLSRDMVQKLTAMRTAADVVLETEVTPEAAEGIRIVCDNVESLRRLLRELRQPLLFLKNTVETVYLDRVVDQALELLEHAIQARGIIVEKEYLTNGQCILFNGAALARTFLDLISSVVRSVQNNHHIVVRLRNGDPNSVIFEINYDGINSKLFGVARRVTDRSVPSALQNHPQFIMAQRTIRSCGGVLSVEHKMEGPCAFRIVLPQKALSASAELKEIGLT